MSAVEIPGLQAGEDVNFLMPLSYLDGKSRKKDTKESSENTVMRQWRAGEIDDAQVILALRPLMDRLARWAADKYAIHDLADDIEQELSLALIGPAGKKWRPEQPISSYLAGWAWRIASGMGGDAAREIPYGELFDASEGDAREAEGNTLSFGEEPLVAYIPPPEEAASRIIEEERVQQHLTTAILAAVEAGIARLDGSKNKKKPVTAIKRKGVPRKRNERLLALRQSVGMTRPEFAAALGLSLSRYAAYESGKTAMPESVYTAALSLIENKLQSVRLLSEIEGLSMSQIVHLWMRKLDMNEFSLADTLGVSRRTMKRWLSDVYKPRHDIVLFHHRSVIHKSSPTKGD